MARKNKNQKKPKQSRQDKYAQQQLTRHLKDIGIITENLPEYYWGADIRAPTATEISRYKRWCHNNGFVKTTYEKTSRQRHDEKLFVQRRSAQGRLDQRKELEKNPRRTYQMIFRGEVSTKDLGRAAGPFEKIGKRYGESSPSGKKALEDLVMAVDRYTDLLDRNYRIGGRENNYLDAILRLHEQHQHWFRSPKDWKPKTHNDERQFIDLARHLLAQYEMPQFMAKVWFDADDLHREWYMHLGRGGNIRTARNLPIELTKKMAHHFLKAPKDYTLCEAFRWGQVFALGGSRRIVEALRQTRICQSYAHDDFWITVIRYFLRHPMLDTAHYNPITDYLYHMRFVPRNRMIARGEIERLPPEQPNLTMKDRDPETLLEQVDAWHARLAKETKYRKHNWEHSSIGEFELEEGKLEKGNLRIWRITELLSTEELRAEGRDMHHCVGSYSGSCASGSVAIFSMSKTVFGHSSKKMLTISVRPSTRCITEARGVYNARPEAKERNILQAWANQENLQVPSYV